MLVKRRPIGFPSMFDDFFGGELMKDPSLFRNESLPAVNVKETEAGFELEVALPGISKEEINLEVNERVLTISSKHEEKKEEKDEKGNYTRKEFSYSSFSRSFTLPKDVDVDTIQGNYVDGVLKVNIPRKAQINNGVKQISIS